MIRHWRAALVGLWLVASLVVFRHGGKLWFIPGSRLHTTVDVAGAVFIAAGGLLRLWSSMYVRRSKGIALVTSGPYGYCQHPLYLGSILMLLGVCLIAQNTLFDLASTLVWIPAYIIKVQFEQAQLHRRFGQAWLDYHQRTPAMVPRLHGSTVPRAVASTPVRWIDALVELPGLIGFALIAVLLESLEHLM